MLARENRVRAAADFRLVTRAGRRSGGRLLVVHSLRDTTDASCDRPRSARVGFVVSKAVGGSVVRNRVKRRLRALVRDRLADLDGARVVVRALPDAAGASFEDLGRALDRGLARSLGVPAAGGST